MTSHVAPPREMREERLAEIEMPDGMVDHNCRTAIRDLIRVYGFDEARALVAMYLNDEADRRH